MTPGEELRQQVGKWLEAMRAKDADAVVAMFASRNVMFVLAPPLQTKHDGAASGDPAAGLRAWFAEWDGPLRLEMADLHVVASDEVAFCHSLNHMVGNKRSGESVDLWFRETMCFHKQGGAWRIVHTHESVPYYMDGSLRAAVDLEP